MNDSTVEAIQPSIPPATSQYQPEPAIAFRYPSGAPARYSLYRKGESGNPDKYRRTWMSPFLLKQPKKKEACPKLACWNRHTREQIIPADFDKLPEGYASFDDLERSLKATYRGAAIVVRTFSQKVKVIFVVRIPENEIMNRETSLRFLKEHLEPGLFDIVDKRHSALTIIALTPVIVTELQDRLHRIPVKAVPVEPLDVGGRVSSGILSIPINTQYEFTIYDGPIEALGPEIRRYIGRSRVREKLVRCLVYRTGLIKDEGFCLSSIMLGRQLGVQQGSITKALKHAQAVGLLEVIDDSFRTGSEARAKRYVALGALRDEITRLAPVKPIVAPEAIEDGTWDEELFDLAQRYYRRPADEFLEAVRGIPGWNLKDRCTKAIRAYNWWRRLNNLPEYPSNPARLTSG